MFSIIERLVSWHNYSNESVLEMARQEIHASWRRTCADNADHPDAEELFDPNRLPAFHDPFAGGGAIPLTAQQLGLDAHASDLNPVAALITKSMIETPSRFSGNNPVNPEQRNGVGSFTADWHGLYGLAEDVRYYGKWIRDEADSLLGHLYPDVEITEEIVSQRPDLKRYAGRTLPVIAWLWARTVQSPNPAFSDVRVPLVSSYVLSTNARTAAFVEPVVNGKDYRFVVKSGTPPNVPRKGTRSGGSRSSFLCLMSGAPMPFDYLRDEGKAGRMGYRLMAIVAQGDRRRVYLSPDDVHMEAARVDDPPASATSQLPDRALGFRVQEYGMSMWRDLFTDRQLTTLTTLSHLVDEARLLIKQDAVAAGLVDDGIALRNGGSGATAYADAISTYLAFCVDRSADFSNSCARWVE